MQHKCFVFVSVLGLLIPPEAKHSMSKGEFYLLHFSNITSDLPGRSLSVLTIPPEVLVTSARPDLIIHDLLMLK